MRHVCVIMLLLLVGCSTTDPMDLPTYPNGMSPSIKECGDEDKETYTAHVRAYRCADAYESVEKWYEEELVTKRGWKRVAAGEWTDGNTDPDDSYYYVTAKDPTKPGGHVVIYKGRDQVQIRMLQVKPK